MHPRQDPGYACAAYSTGSIAAECSWTTWSSSLYVLHELLRHTLSKTVPRLMNEIWRTFNVMTQTSAANAAMSSAMVLLIQQQKSRRHRAILLLMLYFFSFFLRFIILFRRNLHSLLLSGNKLDRLETSVQCAGRSQVAVQFDFSEI